MSSRPRLIEPKQLLEAPFALNSESVPRHVAIIMDGNGRWAKKQGLMRLMGHKSGAKTVTTIVEAASCLKIATLTLFAFSSENWKRPASEVNGLMELLASVLKSESARLHQNEVKVNFVGDLTRFSDRLNKSIHDLVELTKNNQGLKLNIAINYGGRWDIVTACKTIAKKAVNQEIAIDDLNEELFAQELAVPQDVDLLIRTGGESRISNFLLYQCAYSEIFVTERLWPDFTLEDFYQMITAYGERERRFGMTSEQVQASKN